MWWGLTSVLDLLSETKEKDTVNVLLIAQVDSRHILQTIAKKYTHSSCKVVKIYVFEPRIENIARSLLIQTLGLDNKRGLGSKTACLLDLYGNTLIRQSSWHYLQETAQFLIKVITDFSFAKEMLPSITLDNLKYKERDYLENIFKYWSKPDEFDLLTYWDQRVRSSLGIRYDSRPGVFDWDLHMRYKPFGADPLTNIEYKRFRDKGIAFLQDDTDPCIVNVTLSHFTSGSKALAKGYFGDIVTGPYPAYGFDCVDKDMLRKVNGQIRKSATEISEWNVLRMLFEIQNQTEYQPLRTDEGYDVIRKDCSEQLFARRPTSRRIASACDYCPIPISSIEIIYLPESALNEYPKKQEFQELFDLVTVPTHLVSKLPVQWVNMCKTNCKIVVESLKFALSYRKEDLIKAKKDLDEHMNNIGCKITGSYDCEVDEFIRYIYSKDD